MQKKVGDEIAMEQPVEKQFEVNYLPGLVSSLRLLKNHSLHIGHLQQARMILFDPIKS